MGLESKSTYTAYSSFVYSEYRKNIPFYIPIEVNTTLLWHNIDGIFGERGLDKSGALPVIMN